VIERGPTVRARHPGVRTRIVVLNCRCDRPDRSRQLGEVLPGWAAAHRYFLVGTGIYALARTAVASGLSPTLLTPLEGENPGVGFELLRYVRNRARLPEDVDVGTA
jgi:hypothetical protein